MDLEINYYVYKIRQLNPALNQFIQVHVHALAFLKICYFIILQTICKCNIWYLVFSFLTKMLGPLLLSSIRAYVTASFGKYNLIC
jgi:hypothetical protein